MSLVTIPNLHPAMMEHVITCGSSYATISLVGGFTTRLALEGRNLFHFNADEYTKAQPGNAHYGAPFVAPPGINEGFERHGPWRKSIWSLSHQDNASVTIAKRIGSQEISQRFHLTAPNLFEVTVNIQNHDPEKALPFECGLHYYWAVKDQRDIAVGNALNGYPAWDNLAQQLITADSKHVHQDYLDLHVISGEKALKIHDQRQGHTLSLRLDSPSSRTTYVLYATEKDPAFRALEQWSAPQETTKGTWEAMAHKVPAQGSTTYRFAIEQEV